MARPGRLTGAIHKRYIQSSLKAVLNGAVLPQHVPEWWNWQTRRTQNPVGLMARVGSSPSSGTTKLGYFSLFLWCFLVRGFWRDVGVTVADSFQVFRTSSSSCC